MRLRWFLTLSDNFLNSVFLSYFIQNVNAVMVTVTRGICVVLLWLPSLPGVSYSPFEVTVFRTIYRIQIITRNRDEWSRDVTWCDESRGVTSHVV